MLFESGKKVVSPAINDNLTKDVIRLLFNRHLTGDWGDISEPDKRRNEEAVLNGGRIFSGYFTGHGKICVVTDENRRTTKILFADEYTPR